MQLSSTGLAMMEAKIKVVYVTQRIIVLTFSSAGREDSYKRSLRSVLKAIQSRHNGNVKIFNVSRKRANWEPLHAATLQCGWPEELAPPLELLCNVCKEMDKWLVKDAENVVVLHQKGGYRRASVIVSAFMRYCDVCSNGGNEQDYSTMRGFCDQHTLLPSQRRYVAGFIDLLSERIRVNTEPVLLYQMTVVGLSNCYYPIYFKIYSRLAPIFVSKVVFNGSTVLLARLWSPLCLRGDILLKCCSTDDNLKRHSTLFCCQFNTCTIDTKAGCHNLTFPNEELDYPSSGELSLQLIFDPAVAERERLRSSCGSFVNLEEALTQNALQTRNSYEWFFVENTEEDNAAGFQGENSGRSSEAEIRGRRSGGKMHALHEKGGNSYEERPAVQQVHQETDEPELEIPVITDIRGKRASFDVVTPGNLKSLAFSASPTPPWSPLGRKDYPAYSHQQHHFQAPAQSRRVKDTSYGPFESPFRPAILPPSKRAQSPGRQQHARLGAMSPSTDRSDIDVDLVGEDRYDPQSRAFSYVPAKSLVEHFRQPKKQTKMVPTYKGPGGDSMIQPSPPDSIDWLDSLESPIKVQQRQPNFDDLCNPNFYLNFDDSSMGGLSPMSNVDLEQLTTPHSTSTPVTNLDKPVSTVQSPAKFQKSAATDAYERRINQHHDQVDHLPVEVPLTPSSYRSNQDVDRQRPFAIGDVQQPPAKVTPVERTGGGHMGVPAAPWRQPVPVDHHLQPLSQFHSSLTELPTYDVRERDHLTQQASLASTSSHLLNKMPAADGYAGNGFFDYPIRSAEQNRIDSAESDYSAKQSLAATAADSYDGSFLMNDQPDISASNSDTWLDRQMQKLKLKRELTDPHIRKRREQERMLLEELKHVHEERMHRLHRQESDYAVEGIAVKGVEPTEERSPYAVVSKTTHNNSRSEAAATMSGQYPAYVGNRACGPVDESKKAIYATAIHGPDDACQVDQYLVNYSSMKSLSSPKSILKKPKANDAQLLVPFGDYRLPGDQGQMNNYLDNGREDSLLRFRASSTPIHQCSTPTMARPDTPAFPVRRMETPLPFHPLLYAGASSDENAANRLRTKVVSGQQHSGLIRSPSPGSHYYARSVRSSLTSLLEPMEVVHHHPVFVKDTSKYWYKPHISREETILVLKDKQPGAFIIRDSNSFPGAFGLALRVAVPPPGVQTKSNDRSELVRHFLIETTPKGVRLKGCDNEPVFGSLAALVYQHSMTPLALPCKLVLPDFDPAASVEQITTAQQLLDQGAACNVTYLYSNETESLTGPEAVRRTVDLVLKLASEKKIEHICVHFKVSSQGITVTDNERKKFFRRHYNVQTITHCSVDPDNRRWSSNDTQVARIFGFVARKSAGKSENVCHVFAELEPEQPASAIVNFVNKIIMTPSQSIATN